MKIYLASAYGRREEMLRHEKLVEAAGHTVTSRWIQGLHDTPPDGIATDSPEHHRWCAEDDLTDILNADCVISFTGGGTRARGGRHAEFGFGLAIGCRMVLVGPPEHVFHYLATIEQVDSIEEAIVALRGGFEQPTCRECGCTDDHACVIQDGEKAGETCHWAEPDLCSACADESKS